MNLPTEDARHFFKLFFALLAYTNRLLKITPKVSAPSDIPKAGGDALRNVSIGLVQLVSEFTEAVSPFRSPVWAD